MHYLDGNVLYTVHFNLLIISNLEVLTEFVLLINGTYCMLDTMYVGCRLHYISCIYVRYHQFSVCTL